MRHFERTVCSWMLLWPLALSCQEADGEATPGVGTETNWLVACEDESECGDLSCLCGVCTAPCGSAAACPFEGAVCAPAEGELVSEACRGELRAADTSAVCWSAESDGDPATAASDAAVAVPVPEGPGASPNPEPNPEVPVAIPAEPTTPGATIDVNPGPTSEPAGGGEGGPGAGGAPDTGAEDERDAGSGGAQASGCPADPTQCPADASDGIWLCDPGAIPPELDRSCEADVDCTLRTFIGFCGCSALALGYNVSDAERFEQHLASCVDESSCECPTPMLEADNGDAVGMLANAIVECVAGACVTRRDPSACAGADECLNAAGECVLLSEMDGACRETSGECGIACPEPSPTGAYLLWTAPGGAAGVGPALELLEDGTLRLWTATDSLAVRATSSWDAELTLSAAENEALIELLLAVDYAALPHAATEFECYPSLHLEAPELTTVALENYVQASALRPEMDQVFAWLDAYLATNAPEHFGPSSYCAFD